MASNKKDVIEQAIDEIFKETTPPEHVVSIIDYYSKQFNDDQKHYYVLLQDAFYSRKSGINAIKNYPEKKLIRSDINGTILYKNEDSSGWEVLYIIGDPKCDFDSAVSLLKDKLKLAHIDKRKEIVEEYNKELFSSSKTKIILRSKYDNPTLLPMVSINVNVGDYVRKNTIIGTIEFFTYTNRALLAIQKKDIVVSYVSEKMNVHSRLSIKHRKNWFEKKTINQHNRKELNLYDMWLGNDLQYDALIMQLIYPTNVFQNRGYIWVDNIIKNELHIRTTGEEYKLDSPTTINGISFYWGKEPQKGWQRYLAGLFFVLSLYDFINKDDFSTYDLVAICKNTFSIATLDPAVFNDMKAGVLAQKYIDPFNEIVKKLL